jgi:hypothetical protein
MACSTLLHGLAALAVIFGFSYLVTPPPEILEALSIDIVAQGAPGAAAAVLGKPERPEITPSDLRIAEPRITEPLAEIAPRKKPRKPRDTTLPLKSKARQPPHAPIKPVTQPQFGQSALGIAVTDGNGQSGLRTTQSIKDFLRAQIERHLEFDVETLGAVNVVILVHVVLEPDGSVRTAELVDDPRYNTDPLFRSIADSVRRAVIVASPLQLPAGRYDAFHDLVLGFNPREVVQ